MPISQYNHLFTKDKKDTSNAAGKLRANLIKEYGAKKGNQIFYAMVRTKQGASKAALQNRAKGNGNQNKKQQKSGKKAGS